MSTENRKIKLLIDTDPGIDDCHAAMMALNAENVEVVGFSCVAGNTSLENGLRNINFLLKTLGRSDVPVFRGADRALDGRKKNSPHIHGDDGFGGATNNKTIELEFLSEEPAPVALVRFARQFRNELVIAAIGPLTNLVLAQRLDPEFSQNLKELYIMGGNCAVSRFQTLPVGIEFNFACDPIAASVVLDEFQCPMKMVTFEATCMVPIPFETIENEMFAKKDQSDRARLFYDVTKFLFDFSVEHDNHPDLYIGLNSCDSVCMACVIDPTVVKEFKSVYARVEQSGNLQGGFMVTDFYRTLKKKPNVQIISDIDREKFIELFKTCLKE